MLKIINCKLILIDGQQIKNQINASTFRAVAKKDFHLPVSLTLNYLIPFPLDTGRNSNVHKTFRSSRRFMCV